MEMQATPIKGYRNLSEEEIKLINEIKTLGMDIAQLIERMKLVQNIDMRWLSIGTTDLQTGLMALTRSVAQPTNF